MKKEKIEQVELKDNISNSKQANKKKTASYDTKDIPRFGYKSAVVFAIFALVGSLIVPLLLTSLGVEHKLSIIIGNTAITSLGLAYIRHFIESKKGISRSFWIQYGIFAFIFFVISYYWMYYNFYI